MLLDAIDFPFQALPICLDKIFHPFVAVLLSVTFVLAFGEVTFFICLLGVSFVSFYSASFHLLMMPILLFDSNQIIPQAICSRYGLAVGANFLWLVRILMVICYPIAYPIGKVTLLSSS